MNKLIYRLFSVTIAMGMGCAGNVTHAQNPSTVIRVHDDFVQELIRVYCPK